MIAPGSVSNPGQPDTGFLRTFLSDFDPVSKCGQSPAHQASPLQQAAEHGGQLTPGGCLVSPVAPLRHAQRLGDGRVAQIRLRDVRGVAVSAGVDALEPAGGPIPEPLSAFLRELEAVVAP